MSNTTTNTIERPTELAVLRDAADAIKRMEKLRDDLRKVENEVRELCREYDLVMRVWGFQPHHLRRACEARGLICAPRIKQEGLICAAPEKQEG